jgi:hypothetical protein
MDEASANHFSIGKSDFANHFGDAGMLLAALFANFNYGLALVREVHITHSKPLINFGSIISSAGLYSGQTFHVKELTHRAGPEEGDGPINGTALLREMVMKDFFSHASLVCTATNDISSTAIRSGGVGF